MSSGFRILSAIVPENGDSPILASLQYFPLYLKRKSKFLEGTLNTSTHWTLVHNSSVDGTTCSPGGGPVPFLLSFFRNVICSNFTSFPDLTSAIWNACKTDLDLREVVQKFSFPWEDNKIEIRNDRTLALLSGSMSRDSCSPKQVPD